MSWDKEPRSPQWVVNRSGTGAEGRAFWELGVGRARHAGLWVSFISRRRLESGNAPEQGIQLFIDVQLHWISNYEHCMVIITFSLLKGRRVERTGAGQI